MVLTYDEEVVVVSVVEKDLDLGTNFLMAPYHSRLTVIACSSSSS
jgi:hypothetical protein